MARFVKKTKKEIGLSPDDLLFRGKQKMEAIELRVIDFDAQKVQEKRVDTVLEASHYQHKTSTTWFNIDGLHEEKIMHEIGKCFGLEQMLLADVMSTNMRPKVQEYENGIFISIKMLQQQHKDDLLKVENLSLVLTKSVLISFQEKKGDVFNPIRERIRNQKKRIRTSGTDYLLFTLLDIVIDNYIYIIGLLGDKIETLEEGLLTNPNQHTIEAINTYKRELNFLRKNIKPAKEMLMGLSKLDNELINDYMAIHLKELLDNINQANETSDSYREILSDQLNIYHTTISTKLNDIMKFLTVFSVVFIPLTFITGLYGTNFDYLPGAKHPYGYHIMWITMLVSATGLLLYFKKKKWL